MTHSLAEWAAFLSLGVGGYAAFSAPFFLLVDADLVDFDPRPAVRRAAESVRGAAESGRLVPAWLAAVDAGHTASWVAASALHPFRPGVAYALTTCRLFLRDAAYTAAALLILTIPTGSTR